MLADGRLQQRAKLGAVVTDAVRRWYLETEKEALRGDVVSPLLSGACWHMISSGAAHLAMCERRQPDAAHMLGQRTARPPTPLCRSRPLTSPFVVLQKAQALLGQMLIEGYGCQADPVKGREWAEKARRRGYRMDRVYCVL